VQSLLRELKGHFWSFMFDAYNMDESKEMLFSNFPKASPNKSLYLPLVNKLRRRSKKIYDNLKSEFDAHLINQVQLEKICKSRRDWNPYAHSDFETLETKNSYIKR
jgi:hypothetical protein